jgi:hypothetical protein
MLAVHIEGIRHPPNAFLNYFFRVSVTINKNGLWCGGETSTANVLGVSVYSTVYTVRERLNKIRLANNTKCVEFAEQ